MRWRGAGLESMPGAVGTGIVSFGLGDPMASLFLGRLVKVLGQPGPEGRWHSIARASVTGPRRASTLTPAGCARGRLAAPAPRARPASAPWLSSPPWYGRRGCPCLGPLCPLSWGKCPPGLGVLL